MTYYPNEYDPFKNVNNTGAARLLAQQHSDMQKAAESAQIDSIYRDVRELRHRLDELDYRMSPRVSMQPLFIEVPEPSVETTEPSRFWSNFFSDPFFEIFKRPKINP